MEWVREFELTCPRFPFFLSSFFQGCLLCSTLYYQNNAPILFWWRDRQLFSFLIFWSIIPSRRHDRLSNVISKHSISITFIFILTDQKLTSQVHEIVGRINGRFGTLSAVPIHHLVGFFLFQFYSMNFRYIFDWQFNFQA